VALQVSQDYDRKVIHEQSLTSLPRLDPRKVLRIDKLI
jgi:hypothetical protein